MIPKKIDRILGELRESDSASNFRAESTEYAVGDKVFPANDPAFYLACTTAGKTGSGSITIPADAISGTTTISDGTVVWTVYRYKIGGNESPFVYGIDYDKSVATAASACKRIVLADDGSYTTVDNFSQMPAHNFRRCVMSDLAARTVAYYLHPTDSNYKADGTAADLTGSAGDIMVEIPICYWRIDHYTDSNNHAHIVYLIANAPFTNSVAHPYFYVSSGGATLRKQYVGAFHSVICDSTGAPLTTDIEATGSAAYSTGRKARSIIGAKPFTGMSQAAHRTAAGNNGAQGINSLFKQYLQLMMYIDGCSFDTQTAISQGFFFAKTWDYRYTRLTGRTLGFGNATGSIFCDLTPNEITSAAAEGSTVFSRAASHDSGSAFAWSAEVEGGNILYKYTSSATPVATDVIYSDTALSVSWSTILRVNSPDLNIAFSTISFNGTTYFRYSPSDANGFYAWKNGATTYFTTSETPATGADVYNTADNTDTAGTLAGNYSGTAETQKVVAFSYRGIENPYGEIWEFEDGAVADTLNGWYYHTPDTTLYSDTDYLTTYIKDAHAWPVSCYPATWDEKTFFALTTGGSTSTYLCDYFYSNAQAGRVVLRGGGLSDGAYGGAACVYVAGALAIANSGFGARLAA